MTNIFSFLSQPSFFSDLVELLSGFLVSDLTDKFYEVRGKLQHRIVCQWRR
ncbi:MAG: hypothetical protein P8X73_07095 [Ignavibacteriaceae bacterium]